MKITTATPKTVFILFAETLVSRLYSPILKLAFFGQQDGVASFYTHEYGQKGCSN